MEQGTGLQKFLLLCYSCSMKQVHQGVPPEQNLLAENASWNYDRLGGALEHLSYTIGAQMVGNRDSKV
jgi:hypothetical protein